MCNNIITWNTIESQCYISRQCWIESLVTGSGYSDTIGVESYTYEGCSKWIAYFYLETSNFKLAQKYSFHALEVLPVARNAKFQPMYPLLEGVTVRWFGHSNKVLMNGRSKCLSGLVFPPSKECFQFRKQKEITWGKVWGIRGWGKTVTFSFFKNAITIAEVWAGALSCRRRTCLKLVAGRRFW